MKVKHYNIVVSIGAVASAGLGVAGVVPAELGAGIAGALAVSGSVLSYAAVGGLTRMISSLGKQSTPQLSPSASRYLADLPDVARLLTPLSEELFWGTITSQCIDNLPYPVAIADIRDDCKLIYMNNKMRETASEIEPELRKLGVAPSEMIGMSISRFHKDHGRVVEILNNPTRLPWSANVKLGSESMRLRISALYSRDGSYRYAMMNWTNITQELKLRDDFERSVMSVSQRISALSKETARSLSQSQTRTIGAEQKTESTMNTVNEVTANIATVAAASEELYATVQHIVERVSASVGVSNEASLRAAATSQMVQHLKDLTKRIDNIVASIDAIALQINTLALNATIEAARAGDSGKGFSVVAENVKSLATETTQATREISTQIEEVQASTEEAAKFSREIAADVDKLSAAIQDISNSVQEQSTAIREIAQSSGVVSKSAAATSMDMSALRNDVQEVRKLSDDGQLASARLVECAEDLSAAVKQYLESLSNSDR